MEDDSGADIHLQPVEDLTPEQVEAPEGGCGPWEAHPGASSWQDLWTRGERSPRQTRCKSMCEAGYPHQNGLKQGGGQASARQTEESDSERPR
ncbi:AN1-type zinc finger protein 5-like [Grus japonensis]|uniref:AN1-type zinc finger protein 5-like n=1 Tax=Grus japonensis TaxID=30415 RepID=A0ABC9XRN0_GRUJA